MPCIVSRVPSGAAMAKTENARIAAAAMRNTTQLTRGPRSCVRAEYPAESSAEETGGRFCSRLVSRC